MTSIAENLVPRSTPLGNGTRNTPPQERNAPRNAGGTTSLKALATKALERNARWNAAGTRSKNGGTRVEHAAKPHPPRELAWDEETARLIEWFMRTPPPARPFELFRGVTVARPDIWWTALMRDIAEGPNGPRARYGAVQADLRRLAAASQHGNGAVHGY